MRRLFTTCRFDLVELLLVAFFAAFLGWSFRPSVASRTYGDVLTQQEYNRLRERYGPDKYSEHEEEWIIRDFFGDRREGTFVDIGANDYRRGSNTYFLEQNLGWSGIAVDPQESFAAGYLEQRPRTRFFPLFVSDTSNDQVKLFVSRNSLVASSTPEFTESFGTKAAEVSVRTITLTDLLDAARITKIDLLSIDVELAEPTVLAGFDINRFRPRLVCIEGHPQVRQLILDFFARNEYVLSGHYLRIDEDNLWFQPDDDKATGAPSIGRQPISR